MIHSSNRRRELRLKIVYWGPEGSGTTTNLEVLRRRSPRARRQPLTTIEAAAWSRETTCQKASFDHVPAQEALLDESFEAPLRDPFELLSLTVGKTRGSAVRLDLYSVPVADDARRLVLHAVDAVVFVADSAPARLDANKRALAELLAALRAQGRDPAGVPIVFQWNKRELPGATPAATLERSLNRVEAPSVHAAARLGEGVLEALRVATRAALRVLRAAESNIASALPLARAPRREAEPLVTATERLAGALDHRRVGAERRSDRVAAAPAAKAVRSEHIEAAKADAPKTEPAKPSRTKSGRPADRARRARRGAKRRPTTARSGSSLELALA